MTERKKSGRNWVQLLIANEDFLLLSHFSFCFEEKVHFPANASIHPQICFFRNCCLPLETSCLLRYSSFFRRLTKASPMLVGRMKTSITFTFQGKYRRQPSSQARVTSHKFPASSQHLTGSGLDVKPIFI